MTATKKNHDQRRQTRTAYGFLSPWLLLFALFGLFPVIYSLYLSFLRYTMLNPEMQWVGINNYLEVLGDPEFLSALGHTFIFALGTIPFTTFFALVVALLINYKVPLKGLFRSGFFIPSVTSMIVIAIIFSYIYAPNGFLNALLQRSGIAGRFNLPPVNWLMNTHTALACIMAMNVWSSFGYYAILYLAALQTVPEELYEVAVLDGANSLQKFFYITLPHLKQMTLFIMVINTIRTFQVFPEIYTMTRGGPMGATTTVVWQLYKEAFVYFRMGKASAIAYVLFIIITVLAMMQLKLFKYDQEITD